MVPKTNALSIRPQGQLNRICFAEQKSLPNLCVNRIPERRLNIRQAWSAQVGGWLRFRWLLVAGAANSWRSPSSAAPGLRAYQRRQTSRMLCLLVRRSTCFLCERHFKRWILGDLAEFEWGQHLELKEPFVFDCMDECFATCVCQSVGEWACEKGSTLLMRLSRACVIKGLCLWEAAGGYVDECHGKRCRLHTHSSACGSVWKWLPTFC